MQILNVQYFVWLMRRYARELGIYGLLVVFIALVVVTMALKLIQMKNELVLLDAQLQQQTVMLSTTQKKPATPATTLAFSAAKQVANFYTLFPEVSSLSAWLQVIDQTAIQQKLALNHGDYKLNKVNKTNTSLSDSHLIRYEILLPVKGSYVQIRQFIAGILHDLPMLALSDFQIVRENVASTTVEAKLLFTLFLKEST